MSCKYLFETNYAEYVCAYYNFAKLDYHCGRCEYCKEYSNEKKDEELIQSFKKFDEANTRNIENAEYEMDRRLNFSSNLNDLNIKRLSGVPIEECEKIKEEIMKEYNVELEYIFDEKCLINDKPNWIYVESAYYRYLVSVEKMMDWMFD